MKSIFKAIIAALTYNATCYTINLLVLVSLFYAIIATLAGEGFAYSVAIAAMIAYFPIAIIGKYTFPHIKK